MSFKGPKPKLPLESLIPRAIRRTSLTTNVALTYNRNQQSQVSHTNTNDDHKSYLSKRKRALSTGERPEFINIKYSEFTSPLYDIKPADRDKGSSRSLLRQKLSTTNESNIATSSSKVNLSKTDQTLTINKKDDDTTRGDNDDAKTSSLVNKVRSKGKPPTQISALTQISEDWFYLALLGLIMALISFSMDSVINTFLSTRLMMFESNAEDANMVFKYFSWCFMPILLVTLSSAFVYVCSPTAVGSGIPEMKTILRGIVLNEYLTFRTLVSKIVGLTFTLGSGLPLGKEGPFVHMASIVATLLSSLVASFKSIYQSDSRRTEMLSAACAVGVAATFYAPIGGVLFSIEVTTVHFAVSNYWRGFFAACCGATVWRLLCYWLKGDGATCGIAGVVYVRLHKDLVEFFRRHKSLSQFLKQNRFVYPILVTVIITTISFPPFFGKYTASTLNTHETIEQMFSNRTWSLGKTDLVSKRILENWTTDHTGFYLHLIFYMITMFLTSILAATIPTPSGIFIPVLKIGAAYGRLIGEIVHSMFPDGFDYYSSGSPSPSRVHHPAANANSGRLIMPGSYAVAGAAAFSGAVTHTISTSVILFEMTGQIAHLIPVIISVLVANAVCQSLGPSFYDSVIQIKKLPYLPPITSSSSIVHKILVRDFMNKQVSFIWKDNCTYSHCKDLLVKHQEVNSFPVVDSIQTMKLLGSVHRRDILTQLYLQIGRSRRLQEVRIRHKSLLEGESNLITKISETTGTTTESSIALCPVGPSIRVSALSQPKQPPKSILKSTSSLMVPSVANQSTTASFAQQRRQQSSPTPSAREGNFNYGQIKASDSVDFLEAANSNNNNNRQQSVEMRSLTPVSHTRRVRLPQPRVVDISVEEQHQWAMDQMSQFVDLSKCEIDEAPFQLVQQTSLYRVHTLFSMLGLSHAYVTSFGRLVGVVALKDVRLAIERMME